MRGAERVSIETRGSMFRVKVRRGGHNLSASFPTRQEAEAWRASALLAIAKGEAPDVPALKIRAERNLSAASRSAPVDSRPSPPIAQPLTIGDTVREWGEGATRGVVRTRSGGRYRRGTIDTLHYRLRLHVEPYFRGVPVTTVTPGMVRRWLEELEADTSGTTARLALDALRPSCAAWSSTRSSSPTHAPECVRRHRARRHGR